ncbi:thiamine phosphate synthase [Cyclobacterium sp.]|uniref:thiamine phosphate synthase n=1 Tax=Cyclobacterium sp. TaxID=1966343 RepID=UPI00198DD839|nr:thiamine phosphate synthase [Cyclobacterium sp.]MBD3631105.1 thiamine phosphate synthase [Cyclobacterium sp.]
MKKLNLQAKKGIYLIIDPADRPESECYGILEKLCRYPIIALQIWDHFRESQDSLKFIRRVCQVARPYPFPVLINNRWEWIKETGADGVHFDTIPENLEEIKEELPDKSIFGITCNNDQELIQQAEEKGFDYLSFCSLFPSKTANSCDIVSFKTILETEKKSRLPLFLAGGIDLYNLPRLNELSYSGVAVISGIMQAADPCKAMEEYLNQLQTN